MISISTSSAAPGVMERRPTEKNVWRRSVSRPPPVRSSPRPDSISALREGRTGQAEEDALQHFQHEEFARVGGFARQPVEGHMPLVAVFAGGIGEFKLAGHVEARLERRGAVRSRGP